MQQMLHYDAINATTISNIPKYLNKIYIYLKIKVIKFIDTWLGQYISGLCCSIATL